MAGQGGEGQMWEGRGDIIGMAQEGEDGGLGQGGSGGAGEGHGLGTTF